MLNYSRRRILPGAIVRERGERGLIFTVRRLQEAERSETRSETETIEVQLEEKSKTNVCLSPVWTVFTSQQL